MTSIGGSSERSQPPSSSSEFAESLLRLLEEIESAADDVVALVAELDALQAARPSGLGSEPDQRLAKWQADHDAVVAELEKARRRLDTLIVKLTDLGLTGQSRTASQEQAKLIEDSLERAEAAVEQATAATEFAESSSGPDERHLARIRTTVHTLDTELHEGTEPLVRTLLMAR